MWSKARDMCFDGCLSFAWSFAEEDRVAKSSQNRGRLVNSGVSTREL